MGRSEHEIDRFIGAAAEVMRSCTKRCGKEKAKPEGTITTKKRIETFKSPGTSQCKDSILLKMVNEEVLELSLAFKVQRLIHLILKCTTFSL